MEKTMTRPSPSPSGGQGLPAPTVLNVNVIIYDVDSKGFADYAIRGADPASDPYVKASRIDLPARSGRYEINFHLDDKGRRLEFNTGGPIWVRIDGVCPTAAVNDGGQIGVSNCQAKILTATNANSNAQPMQLTYTLVLTGPDGQVLVDPIITNGGGSTAN